MGPAPTEPGQPGVGPGPGDAELDCIFAKALLAQTAACALSRRRAIAERIVVACGSPVAHTNCATLAALLYERARFALRLPAPGRPLIHMQALRLQCGGLTALREVLGQPVDDVHEMVGLVHERHGSLTELPWDRLVALLAAWKPRQRARP